MTVTTECVVTIRWFRRKPAVLMDAIPAEAMRIVVVLVVSQVAVIIVTTITSTTALETAHPARVVTATMEVVLTVARCREVPQFVAVEPTTAQEPS